MNLDTMTDEYLAALTAHREQDDRERRAREESAHAAVVQALRSGRSLIFVAVTRQGRES